MIQPIVAGHDGSRPSRPVLVASASTVRIERVLATIEIEHRTDDSSEPERQ